MSYYTSVILINLVALTILCILVRENARLESGDKRTFYITYAMIACASLAEWGGVMLNGREDVPAIVISIVKCFDYICTPLAEAYFVEQMKLRNIWRRIIRVLLVFNTIFQIISVFTGWVAVIDEHHCYGHGPLYPVYIVLCFTIMLLLIIEFVIYGKSFSRQNRRSLYAIMFLVFFGIMIQETLGGMNRTTYLAFTIGAILMFVHYTEFSLLEADELLLEQRMKLRETDALRAAKQAAEDASRAKSDFLASMSHEIRTPINAVLGMNEMILRESKEPDILEYAEGVQTAGSTLLGLINDILDFSKIEAGKIEILPVDYDITFLISDLVNMIHTRADEKGLELKLAIDRNIPRMLYGDEIRIKQVITNILTNAVKYTEKGSVSFEISSGKDPDDPNNVLMKIAVRDTGIGIREEDMDKLFSEFERIEEARNRKIEGTGLGMSITMRLLELMGSKLQVESTYGEGSCFSFVLRQKVVKWDPIGDYRSAHHNGDHRHGYRETFTAPDAHVLVIDDNPMNLMVFKSLIKQTLVQIDLADNGDEGLQCCRERKYDMIFLDHMMPGKDGMETLRELRGDTVSLNCRTPVICLTANAISGAREKYISAGFEDYLPKPIDAAKLEEMMMEYISDALIIKTVKQPPEDSETDNAELAWPEELSALLDQNLIDVDAGLANNGDAASYLPVLRFFYESAEEKAKEIDTFYKEENLPDYAIRVHALKSSARIIGATDLGNLAQLLEDAGKTGDLATVQKNHDTLIRDLLRLRELLSNVFPSKTASTDLPEASDDDLREAFDEILSAADQMDYDRITDIFETLSGFSIPADRQKQLDQIKALADALDYDKIRTLLTP